MSLGPKPKRPIDRFNALVKRTDTCWLWIGYQYDGYGKFSATPGKCAKAHRWSYEHFIGPIPAGLDLDHLCRVRSCVNPAHLEPVTRKVNLNRSPTACKAGGAALAKSKKARSHCVNGHRWDQENTLLSKEGWRICRACARERARKKRPRLDEIITPQMRLGVTP